jgi:hypothetical protein
MNRWLSIVVACAATALAGCNPPKCGPGTVQMQNKNGTLDCVPADVMQGAGIPCDADGGATVQGGSCVSAVTCGPGTTLMGNRCVSNGGTGSGCSQPALGTACVYGSLVNFLDNTAATATVHVQLVDPLSFLGGGTPIAEKDATGSYVFQDFKVPPQHLIAIIVTNPQGTTTYYTTATGDQGINNDNVYRVDGYVLEAATVQGWKPEIDVDAVGAYVAKFYNDPKPLNTLLIANETNPVAGVQLTQSGLVVAGAKYFGATLATIDAAATSTSTIGAAIIPAPDITSGFPNFSGTGPTASPITWESQPGASKKGAVFVTRFHPNM